MKMAEGAVVHTAPTVVDGFGPTIKQLPDLGGLVPAPAQIVDQGLGFVNRLAANLRDFTTNLVAMLPTTGEAGRAAVKATPNFHKAKRRPISPTGNPPDSSPTHHWRTGDEGVTEAVGRYSLGAPGSLGQALDGAVGGVAVHAGPVRPHEDRLGHPFGQATGRSPGWCGGRGDGDELAAALGPMRPSVPGGR